MDPLYLVAVPGIVLILAGSYAVFKVAQAPGTEIELFGLKMKTPVPGLVMIGIGAVILYPAVIKYIEQDIAERNLPPSITEVTLRTEDGFDSVEYGATPCPIDIPLTGRIAIGRNGGIISYRFVRTTGGVGAPAEAGPVRQLSFDSPGSAVVADTVRVTIPQGVVQIQEYLEIVEPDSRKSESVRITVTCDPDAPGRPPIDPPNVEPPPG